VAVDELVADLVRRIRAGEGPKFVTAKTYRLYGHTASDPAAYRSKEEVEERWKSDPVAAVRGLLVRLGVAEADLDALRDAAQREIATAIEVATSAPWPAIETAFDDVQDVGAPR
jgi:acetoin:2,6-dichlorophenolindophenol oxidoreductase subunit alpha